MRAAGAQDELLGKEGEKFSPEVRKKKMKRAMR